MLERYEIQLIIEQLITELKNKGFIHKQKRPKEVLDAIKANKEENKKDVSGRNQETLQRWISTDVFKRTEYDYPDEGPYDYRYIINRGEKITPTKAMLAMYWKEKSLYTKLGKNYSFPTKGMAVGVMMSEIKSAELLASSIEFKDFRKLVELVDDKYQEMFKSRGGFEWKLKNLCENIYLLTQ